MLLNCSLRPTRRVGVVAVLIATAYSGSALSQTFVPPEKTGKLILGIDAVVEEYNEFLLTPPTRPPGSTPPGFQPSDPGVRVVDDSVVVDIVADNVEQVSELLRELGMTNIAIAGNMVSGLLPLSQIDAASAIPDVRNVRPSLSSTRTGSVKSQGDRAMFADEARFTYFIDGSGVQIGVLSDSYDNLGGEIAGIASGDLPPAVTVLSDLAGGGSDEGRAMIELIHDVAPGAEQAFHTAFNGIADFALGIQELAGCPAGSFPGCTADPSFSGNVVVDDVFYFASPYFQDGVIAQAVDVVKEAGVAYFSSAGNSANQSYEADFIAGPIVGDYTTHDFDPGPGTDELQQITIPVGQQVRFILQWDQPYFSVSGAPGSMNDLDMFLLNNAGVTVASSTADNIAGDPLEGFVFFNDGSSGSSTFSLIIAQFNPAGGPAPGKVKYIYYNSNVTIDEFATDSSTIVGQTNAKGAFSIGAAPYFQTPAFGVSPPQLEPFSSIGSTDILFDTSGNPIIDIRNKPDFVGPDGADTTFFGVDIEPNGFPNFFGTSASAPHVAAAAALALECDPSLTPDRLKQAFAGAAIEMDAPGFDNNTGFGYIDSLVTSNIVCQNVDKIGTFQASSKRFSLDYDGDGQLDDSSQDIITSFGISTDIPISGDWNGDGNDEIGMYRPSNNRFYLDINGNGIWDGSSIDQRTMFDSDVIAGDLPVTGDWDGDGIDNVGLFRTTTNRFYLDFNGNGIWDGTSVDIRYDYGIAGDLPVTGDWLGSGVDAVGVYRPSNQNWYLDTNYNGVWEGPTSDSKFNFGITGDIPVVGNWTGSAMPIASIEFDVLPSFEQDKIGVYRPSTKRFYLDADGSGTWDGTAVDLRFTFGRSGDVPVIGKW